MSQTKIQKEFVDLGFGFPIQLRQVPMIKVRGVWTPQVNYEQLAQAALKALCFKPARLTGHEVRFIRLQLGMTLEEFADRFCVTHPSVIKWEKQGDEPTKMQWCTEKDIRLSLLLQTEGEEHFVALYKKLESVQSARKWTNSIDVNTLAA